MRFFRLFPVFLTLLAAVFFSLQSFADDGCPAKTPLELRAEKGDLKAQSEVGDKYLRDPHVKYDPGLAGKWALRAAERGDAKSQDNVSLLYRTGIGGFPVDQQQSVFWMRKAAGQNYARSQYKLGRAYCDGVGVEKNSGECKKWLLRAAENGNAAAMFHLGLYYHEGIETNVDEAVAVSWFLKSAHKGNITAAEFLGDIYLKGSGVKRDAKQALDWYLKAAKMKYPSAMKAVIRLYHAGDGVKKDDGEALYWLEIYDEGGKYPVPEAKTFRAEIEPKLSPKKIAAAKSRAGKWRKAHPPLKAPPAGMYVEDPAGKELN